MQVETYGQAADFLARARTYLEANEAANSLLLGIALRLDQFPERIEQPPYLATVADEERLAAAAIMTPPWQMVIYSDQAEPGPALDGLGRDLAANDWPVPGVLGPAQVSESFADLWAKRTGVNVEPGMRQRIYRLTKVIPPRPAPGQLRLAEEDDLAEVTEWLDAFQQEALRQKNRAKAETYAANAIQDQNLYLWVDQQPVSMVAKSRPTTNGITVNMVYTPPEHRRKGYATACVADLSQRLLDSGWKFCALFTDLANPTSNRIYQSIGYEPVCDMSQYLFKAE